MPSPAVSSNVQPILQSVQEHQPFPTLLPAQQPWYEFTRHNGYMALAKRLLLKVETNKERIRELWEEFSSKESVYDLWQFRGIFMDQYDDPAQAITLSMQSGDGLSPVGILPICFDPDSGMNHYTWIGFDWPEDNVFHVTNEEIIPLLLMVAPSPLVLPNIRALPRYSFLKDFPGFTVSAEKRYTLDLTKYSTIEAYLSSLKKKKRYNIRRDQRIILQQDPEIQIDQFAHIERLFDLNVERLRSLHPDTVDPNNKSSFEDEREKQVFRAFVAQKEPFKARMVSTIINGKVEAVEIAVVYGKAYYALCCGANVMRYSGLGVFSNLKLIEDAMNLGCERIDFMSGNYNWKNSWNLTTSDTYTFEK